MLRGLILLAVVILIVSLARAGFGRSLCSGMVAAVVEQLHPLVVLVGPTASGKTALALRLAKQFDGEIVSCDAVAVYRGHGYWICEADGGGTR